MAQVSQRAFTCFCLVTFIMLLVQNAASSDIGEQPPTQKPVPVNQSQNAPVASAGTNVVNESEQASVQKPSAASGNCTNANDTECDDGKGFITSFLSKITENRDMLLRTMYVLFGVTGVVVIYFIVRAWRLRRKRNKSRKYGVIASRGDLEMEPLGHGDDEDEDYTVFEMNGRTKK